MTPLLTRYEAHRFQMAKIHTLAQLQQDGDDWVMPEPRMARRHHVPDAPLHVNWWAVLGGAVCALTVALEIALVAWVVSW